MNCKRCENPLVEGDQFCKNCGERVMNNNLNNFNNANGGETLNNNFQNNVTPNYQKAPSPFVSVQENNTMAQTYTNPQSTFSTYQSPINNQMPNNNQKSNKNMIIIAIVAVILVGVLGIFVGKVLFGNDNQNGTNENTNTNTNTSNNDSSNNDSADPVTTSNTYKVRHQGFTFDIPEDYIYQVKGKTLYLTDTTDTWMAAIEALQMRYSQILAAKSQVLTNIRKTYPNSKMVEKNIGGKSFLVFEIEEGGQKVLLFYTESKNNYVFGGTIINIEKTDYDYELLEEVATILKDATYDSNDSSLSIETKLPNVINPLTGINK